MSTTHNTKMIRARPEQVYRAFTDARALEAWMAPGDMTARVLHFDLREGGSYEMALSYPASDRASEGDDRDKSGAGQGSGGKSGASGGQGAEGKSGVGEGGKSGAGEGGKSGPGEDRYVSRFVALEPGRRIVEAIRFDSEDASFQGEMTMEVTFEPVGSGSTLVSMTFRDIPAGIRPEDNEKGTELSLQKLAAYVEGK